MLYRLLAFEVDSPRNITYKGNRGSLAFTGLALAPTNQINPAMSIYDKKSTLPFEDSIFIPIPGSYTFIIIHYPFFLYSRDSTPFSFTVFVDQCVPDGILSAEEQCDTGGTTLGCNQCAITPGYACDTS